VMKLLSKLTVPVAADAGENTNIDVNRVNAITNGRNLALLFTIYPLVFGLCHVVRHVRF
jgi:hypothetical protein